MKRSYHLKTQTWAHLALLMLLSLSFGPALRGQITVTKTDATCGMNDGSASVTVNHGTPPYTFQWSNGASGAGISNLGPGTYTVTVTDANQCKGNKSVTIVSKKGSLSVSMSGGGEVPFCIQDGPPVITLTASVSGGTPPYHWAPAQSITVSGSGRYSIGVSDSNNCFGKATSVFTFIPIRCSRDPNEIIGPEGYGESRYVSSRNPLNYLINFENDPEFATAPAQKVVVSYLPDPQMNLTSLRLGDFGFGSFFFTVPPNSSFYSTRLDLTDSLGIFVDVTAGINVGNNTAFWILQTIDPATGLPPEDPMTGFLPVNDSLTHQGEGFVSFSIRPKMNTQTGDTLKADAVIVFDINPPLATNTWTNIADAGSPASQVAALPASVDSNSIALSVTGADDTGGSGPASFELYVAEGGGTALKQGSYPWGEQVIFGGNPCTAYSFYSIAVDHTGNREADKTTPEAATVFSPAPEFPLQPADLEVPLGQDAVFAFTPSNGIFFLWEMSQDGGNSFSTLAETPPYSGTQSTTLTVAGVGPGLNGMQFRCLVSNGGCYSYTDTVSLLVIASLSGSLLYDNALQSPMSNTRIILYTPANTPADTAMTNPAGSYLFSDVEPGQYLAGPDIDKPWGGANATDALLVLRHFASLDTLRNLRLEAADVNLNNQLNAIDALLIVKRFVQLMDSFPAGDWILQQAPADLGSTSQVLNFTTLCYGDVDGSFIPGLKTSPGVYLDRGETLEVNPGQDLTLPLVLTRDITAGAVSLVISYPAGFLELLEVTMKNQNLTDDLLFSRQDDQIRLAWYSLAPCAFDQGDPLVSLHFSVKDRPLLSDLAFSLDAGSEVAGKEGLPMENLRLLIPDLKPAVNITSLYLGQNFPNPCSGITEINFYLPAESETGLILYDRLGQQIRVLAGGRRASGFHRVLFDAAGLAAGMYTYRLTVSNPETKTSLFRMMTVGQ